MLRTEVWEYVFFLVFVAVCWITAPLVALLHITNARANGIALAVAFVLGVAAIEWVKKRVMGAAKSRYVAKAVLWSSIGVPAGILAVQWSLRVSYSEAVQFAIYLVATLLVLATMAVVAQARARMPAGASAAVATVEAEPLAAETVG